MDSFMVGVTLISLGVLLFLLTFITILVFPHYAVVRLERLSKGGWKAYVSRFVPWRRTFEYWVCSGDGGISASWFHTTSGRKVRAGDSLFNVLHKAVERAEDLDELSQLVDEEIK